MAKKCVLCQTDTTNVAIVCEPCHDQAEQEAVAITELEAQDAVFSATLHELRVTYLPNYRLLESCHA